MKDDETVPFEKAANGCFPSNAIGMYADGFIQADCLDQRFVDFMCLNGPRFFGLGEPGAKDRIVLIPWENGIIDPVEIPGEKDTVIPLGYVRGGPPAYRTPFIEASPSF